MRRILLAAALASAMGCSWSRFDDLEKDSPVVSLERPSDLRAGFGIALASVSLGGAARLLVSGTPGISGGAAYDVSHPARPITDALDIGYCRNPARCFMSSRPSGMARAPSAQPTSLCFALGLGELDNGDRGVLVRCDGNTSLVLTVPEAVRTDVLDPKLDRNVGEPPVLSFAADQREQPTLVAGLGQSGRAWFYPAGTAELVELPAPEGDTSFGAAVAVVRSSDLELVVVAAPEQGRVWLFRVQEGAAPETLGCIAGQSGFGRALAVGQVTSDGPEDLVIADAGTVSVVDGAVLAGWQPSADGTCVDSSTVSAGTLRCAKTGDVGGCAGSDFGAAVAAGDIDGDGDAEIAVGAPGASVRGRSSAGAVLVYDFEADSPGELSDVAFASSIESGDRLGAAVAFVRVGDHDVLAAGAPGAGKTLMFYCTGRRGSADPSGRCK